MQRGASSKAGGGTPLSKGAESALIAALRTDDPSKVASVIKLHDIDVKTAMMPSLEMPILQAACSQYFPNAVRMLMRPVGGIEEGFGADPSTPHPLTGLNCLQALLIPQLASLRQPSSPSAPAAGKECLATWKAVLDHPSTNPNVDAPTMDMVFANLRARLPFLPLPTPQSNVPTCSLISTLVTLQCREIIELVLAHPKANKLHARHALEELLTTAPMDVNILKIVAVCLKGGVVLTNSLLTKMADRVYMTYADDMESPKYKKLKVLPNTSKLLEDIASMFESGLLTHPKIHHKNEQRLAKRPDAPLFCPIVDEGIVYRGDSGDDEMLMPLVIFAIHCGPPRVLKYFLEKWGGDTKALQHKIFGCVVPPSPLIHIAAGRHSVEMLRYLLTEVGGGRAAVAEVVNLRVAARGAGGIMSFSPLDLAIRSDYPKPEFIRALVKDGGAAIDGLPPQPGEVMWSSPLCMAGAFQKWEVVPTLIELGADVNYLPKHQFELTILQYAIHSAHMPTIKLVLKKGANPNMIQNDLVVAVDALRASEEVLQAVLDSPKMNVATACDTDGCTFLHHAAGSASTGKLTRVLQKLEKEKLDKHTRIKVLNARCKDTLLTPLMVAIQHNPLNVLPLMKAGADVASCPFTGLQYMAPQFGRERAKPPAYTDNAEDNLVRGLVRRKDVKTLKMLLMGNLQRLKLLEDQKGKPITPLQEAKLAPAVDLSATFDKDTTNMTPLLLAVSLAVGDDNNKGDKIDASWTEVIELLLEAGADVTAQTLNADKKPHQTALHMAAAKGKRALCAMLLKPPPPACISAPPLHLVSLANADGLSPYNLAGENGHTLIEEDLQPFVGLE